MARVQSGSDIVLNPPVNVGLEVVFGGVEVFEVKGRGTVGWKLATVAAALAGMILTLVIAWAAAAGGQFRVSAASGLLALLAGFIAVGKIGVVWRFDHKRKTVVRKHWMHGASRTWKTQKVHNIVLKDMKNKLGGDELQLALVDGQGNVMVELGRWAKDDVDRAQVEGVVKRIKDVMWWK
jgi:hypothetical protein